MFDLKDLRKNLGKKHVIYVDDPHPQSLASRVFLKTELSIRVREQWLTFRKEYLDREVLEKGTLTCHFCGKPNLDADSESRSNLATLDHVIPRSKGGGEYDLSNLVVACQPCNSKKGSLDYKEYMESKLTRS